MSTFRFLTYVTRRSVAAANYKSELQQYVTTLTSVNWNNRNNNIKTNIPVRNHYTLIGQHWSRTNDYTWKTNDLQAQFPLCRRQFGTKSSPDRAGKSESKSASAAVAENDIFGETSKLGLFAKFKLMYKKYWYVMLPVHCITSCFWFGGFYYMSKSGVDIPSMLQYLHLSETIIEKLQHSDMGHLAVAYLCYKVATPLRYAVTLGGTTISIKHLVQAGHIKPMPSKEQFMQMYEQKKADRAAAKAEKEAEKEAEITRQEEEQKRNK